MPFNGDEFSRLGLPPYSGPLAAELQNLARRSHLTLKGETATIDNAAVRLAIGGMPGDGQVIKFDLATTSLVWRDDNVGMAGGGEENVQVDWERHRHDLRRLHSEQARSLVSPAGWRHTHRTPHSSIYRLHRHALYHTIEPRLGQRATRRADSDRRLTAVHFSGRNHNRYHPAHWRWWR